VAFSIVWFRTLYDEDPAAFKRAPFLKRLLEVFRAAQQRGVIKVSPLRGLAEISSTGQQDPDHALNRVVTTCLKELAAFPDDHDNFVRHHVTTSLRSDWLWQDEVTKLRTSLLEAVCFVRDSQVNIPNLRRGQSGSVGVSLPPTSEKDPSATFVVSPVGCSELCEALAKACAPNDGVDWKAKPADMNNLQNVW
jgi:hypothetical protein